MGVGWSNCISSVLDNPSGDCERYLEWNARTQLTTWKPVSKESTIPQGPIEYAAKHWQGLIIDYYARRAQLTLEQAMKDEAAGLPLNKTAIDLVRAQLAFNFTTANNNYSLLTIGSAPVVSRVMYDKYAHWFGACDGEEDDVIQDFDAEEEGWQRPDSKKHGPESRAHGVVAKDGR